METCSIGSCSNSTEKNLKLGLSVHKFPQKGEKRKQWIDACCRPRFVPTSNSVICSIHFDETFFQWTADGKVLSPAAIPTMFLPNTRIEALCRKRKKKIPQLDSELYFSSDRKFNALCKDSSLYQFFLNPADILRESRKIVKSSHDIANEILDVAVKNNVGHPEIGVKYTNPYDYEIQRNLKVLGHHIKSNLFGERPISYKCYPCHNVWWHLQEYRDHLLTHKKVTITVEYFDKQPSLIAYDKKITVKSHERDDKCPKCGNKIENAALQAKLHCPKCISRHNKDVTKNLKNGMKCNICKRFFDGYKNFQEHLMSHDVRSDYPIMCDLRTCKFCHSNYPSKSHHYCLNRGTNVQCSYCSRRFVNSALAKDHMKNNQGVYKCDICGLKLKSNCVKFEHMLSHSKMYTIVQKCKLCKGFKVFISGEGAILHFVIHHQDLMFEKEKYACSIIIPKSCVSTECRRVYKDFTDEYPTAVTEIGEESSIPDEEDMQTNVEYLDETFDYDFNELMDADGELESLADSYEPSKKVDANVNELSTKVDNNKLLEASSETVENNTLSDLEDNETMSVDFLDEEFFDETPEIEPNKPSKKVDNNDILELYEHVEELDDEFYPELKDEDSETSNTIPETSDDENSMLNAVENTFQIEVSKHEVRTEFNDEPATIIELHQPSKAVDNNLQNTVVMENMVQVPKDTVFKQFNDLNPVCRTEPSKDDNNPQNTVEHIEDVAQVENNVFQESTIKLNEPLKKIDNVIQQFKDEIKEPFIEITKTSQDNNNSLNTLQKMDKLEDDFQHFNIENPKSIIDFAEPSEMVDNNPLNERNDIKNKMDINEDKCHEELKDKINDENPDYGIDLNEPSEKVDNDPIHKENMTLVKILYNAVLEQVNDDISDCLTNLNEPSIIDNNIPLNKLDYVNNDENMDEDIHHNEVKDNTNEDVNPKNETDLKVTSNKDNNNLLHAVQNNLQMVIPNIEVFQQLNHENLKISSDINESTEDVDDNPLNEFGYLDNIMAINEDELFKDNLNVHEKADNGIIENELTEKNINNSLNTEENLAKMVELLLVEDLHEVYDEITESSTEFKKPSENVDNPLNEQGYLDSEICMNRVNYSELFEDKINQDNWLRNCIDLNEPPEVASSSADHNLLNTEEHTENMIQVHNDTVFELFSYEHLQTTKIELNEPLKEINNNQHNYVENVLPLELNNVLHIQQLHDDNPEIACETNEPTKEVENNPLNAVENTLQEEMPEDEVNQAFNYETPATFIIDLNEPLKKALNNPQCSMEDTENMLFVKSPNVIVSEQLHDGNLHNSEENVQACQQFNDQMPQTLTVFTEPEKSENPQNLQDGITKEGNKIEIEIEEEIYKKMCGENNLETEAINEESNYNEAEITEHNDMSEDEPEHFVDDIIILDFGTDENVEITPEATVTKIVPEIDDTNLTQPTTEQGNVIDTEGIDVKTEVIKNEIAIKIEDLASLLEATTTIGTDRIIQINEENWKTEDYLEVIDNISDVLCSERENTLVRVLLEKTCLRCGPNRRIYKCTRCNVQHKTMDEYLDHFFNHDYIVYTCPKCPEIFLNNELIHLHVKLHILFEDGTTKCYTVKKYLCRFKVGKALMKLPDFFENWEAWTEIARIFPTREDVNNNGEANSFVDIFLRETTTQRHKKYNECVLCGARFTIHVDYKMHLIDHLLTDAKMYYNGHEFKCRLCAAGSATGEEYAVHMMRHANLTFNCEKCCKKIKKLGSKPRVNHLECDFCERFYRCVEEIEGIKDNPFGIRNIQSDIISDAGLASQEFNLDALHTDNDYDIEVQIEVEVTTTVDPESTEEEDEIPNTADEISLPSNEEMMVDVAINEVDPNDDASSSWYNNEQNNVETYCNLNSFLRDSDDPMLSHVDGLRTQREISHLASLQDVVTKIDSYGDVPMFERATDSMDNENTSDSNDSLFSRKSTGNKLNDVFDFPIDIENENQTDTFASEKVIKTKSELKRVWSQNPTPPILKQPKRTKLTKLKIEMEKENQPEMYAKEIKKKNALKRKQNFRPPSLKQPKRTKYNDYVVLIPVEVVNENHTATHTTENVFGDIVTETNIWEQELTPPILKYDDYVFDIQQEIENINQTETYDTTNEIKIESQEFYTGKSVRVRKPKPPKLKSPKPSKCGGNCHGTFLCKLFSERRRRKICDFYWSLNPEEQYDFIVSCVRQEPRKNNLIGGQKLFKTSHSRKYYFVKDGAYQRVCCAFFISTLCISYASVTKMFKSREALLQTRPIMY